MDWRDYEDFIDVYADITLKDGTFVSHDIMLWVDENALGDTGFSLIPGIINELAIEEFFKDISVVEIQL